MTTMEKFLLLMFLLACLMIGVVLRLWEEEKQTLCEIQQNYIKVATECRVLKEENKQLRQLLSNEN